jgi:hypothetical protein
VFRVVPSATGAGWMVTPPAMMPVTTPTPVVRGSSARQPIALADFEQRVRALVGGAK